jgi:hypothetical protein
MHPIAGDEGYELVAIFDWNQLRKFHVHQRRDGEELAPGSVAESPTDQTTADVSEVVDRSPRQLV